MQQVTFNIDEFVNLSSLKKTLNSIKGISGLRIEENPEEETTGEHWFDEEFPSKQSDSELDERLERSLQQSREGKVTPYNSAEMRKRFKAKI